MPDPVARVPALHPDFLRLPIAHRGLHDRSSGVIENSRAAVHAAIANGYGIEIDLQLSADGEAMVFHDDGLTRLTGRAGRVRDHAAADLGRIPLTDAADGETIPTLAEVLSAVAGRVPLLVEVKDQDGALGPNVGPLERRVATLLAGHVGPVAVMSFNPHSVAALRDAAPSIARGLTTDAFDPSAWPSVPPARCADLGRMATFDAVGAGFISHDRRSLDTPQVAALAARGVPVLTWTIRSPEQEAAARRFAQGITFEGYRAALPTG